VPLKWPSLASSQYRHWVIEFSRLSLKNEKSIQLCSTIMCGIFLQNLKMSVGLVFRVRKSLKRKLFIRWTKRKPKGTWIGICWLYHRLHNQGLTKSSNKQESLNTCRSHETSSSIWWKLLVLSWILESLYLVIFEGFSTDEPRICQSEILNKHLIKI
jgi:hypothetical protein